MPRGQGASPAPGHFAAGGHGLGAAQGFRLGAAGWTLVALVLLLVGLAISTLTSRSTREQVVRSVGDTVQSVAQSLDAADNTNRELVQLTMKGFQRYFEATMQLNEETGELRSYGALVNEDYSAVDKFANETGGVASVFARKGEDFIRITTSVKNEQGQRQQGTNARSQVVPPTIHQAPGRNGEHKGEGGKQRHQQPDHGRAPRFAHRQQGDGHAHAVEAAMQSDLRGDQRQQRPSETETPAACHGINRGHPRWPRSAF